MYFSTETSNKYVPYTAENQFWQQNITLQNEHQNVNPPV